MSKLISHHPIDSLREFETLRDTQKRQLCGHSSAITKILLLRDNLWNVADPLSDRSRLPVLGARSAIVAG
jgi:hypothetical protein